MTFGRPSLLERRREREAEKNRNLSALLHRLPLARSGTYAGTSSGEPVKKECASQHAGYQAAVRDLGYCMRCRCSCRPQFCHRDEGKGMGIKTDVREGWPGCAGCHWIVGTSGHYQRDEKRALELELGRRTRNAVRAAGTWPARLAPWEDK